MKLNLEVNNLSRSDFRKSFFEKIFAKTFLSLDKRYVFLDKADVLVSLALVDPEEMKRLNRDYRKLDRATDVLSFSEYGSLKAMKDACGKSIFLGEIVLCYNYIEKYAKSKEKAKVETARVFSHGLLHLLNFRHGKRMFDIQDNVASNIK